MPSNDLEYAMELGARVARAAVGLGAHLALAPVRLALRAVQPAKPEPRWAPIDDPRVPDQRAPAPAATPTATPVVAPEPAAPVAPIAPVAPAEPDTGPGPEIHIEPPWPGYDAMNVAAVVTRLRGANPTVVAMVRLYEETHKNRRGVLQATGG
jgi:hypothetical protein